MDESKFALSCLWCTEGLRLCADSIRRRMYSVRAGGTTGVAGMSAMPQRPGEAQGQTVPGVADGAHRLEARVATVTEVPQCECLACGQSFEVFPLLPRPTSGTRTGSKPLSKACGGDRKSTRLNSSHLG